MPHHPVRRRAGHGLVEHRKRPGQPVAHVAGNAREPGLQHQDANPRAIQRLAAMRDPRHLTLHGRLRVERDRGTLAAGYFADNARPDSLSAPGGGEGWGRRGGIPERLPMPTSPYIADAMGPSLSALTTGERMLE